MNGCFSRRKGVSINLINKQISLKSSDGVYIVSFSDSFFNIGGSIDSSKQPNTTVLSGDLNGMKYTANYGISYRTERTHLADRRHTRLSYSDKLRWFFVRFRYSGKGLKVKKGSSTCTVLFNLGSSHISKLHYNPSSMQILRTKKNTYTIISPSPRDTISPIDIMSIRPYNIYTRRGLRLCRQSVIRRFGKVSQLIPKKK